MDMNMPYRSKTLKVIVHSNQLSRCSVMKMHCLKLKLSVHLIQNEETWMMNEESEADPKFIHSLELNRDVSDSCSKCNVTKKKKKIVDVKSH